MKMTVDEIIFYEESFGNADDHITTKELGIDLSRNDIAAYELRGDYLYTDGKYAHFQTKWIEFEHLFMAIPEIPRDHIEFAKWDRINKIPNPYVPKKFSEYWNKDEQLKVFIRTGTGEIDLCRV